MFRRVFFTRTGTISLENAFGLKSLEKPAGCGSLRLNERLFRRFHALTAACAPLELCGPGTSGHRLVAARRRRAALLRALGLGFVLLALTDPSLVRENRKPLKDVVAIVVDQSGSQTIGDRMAQTEKATADLKRRLEALGNIDVRIIESGRNDTENNGTRLFSALNQGLAMFLRSGSAPSS